MTRKVKFETQIVHYNRPVCSATLAISKELSINQIRVLI